MDMDKNQPVHSATAAIKAYNDVTYGDGHKMPLEKSVRDLLADLQYYCESEGIDFEEELRRSRSYFQSRI